MTFKQALKKNPFDPARGSIGAYIRYLRYNVKGWYTKDSAEIRREVENEILNSMIIDDVSEIEEVDQGMTAKECYELGKIMQQGIEAGLKDTLQEARIEDSLRIKIALKMQRKGKEGD